MALADTANLLVKLNLGGNFLSQIGKATTGLNRFDKSASRAYVAGQQIGTGLRNTGRVAVAAAASLGTLAVASAKVAADFESQLNTINTVFRGTPEQLGKIGDAIRKIARETGTSTDDLTQGYYDLVSAGIQAADATSVLEAANRLAIGGLATAAETVDLLTTAINTYGGDASKAAAYADVFAKAIERGKVTAAEIAQSFAQVGPIAAASGIEIGELGAAYARLTAAGVPAAEAAIQVRAAIVSLTRRTADLERLEKATGKSYLAIAGSKGLVVALEELRKDADKSDVPLIDLLGRVEGLNFALATTGPNFDKYNADLAAMGDAAGTAAEQMSERQQGLNFQLAKVHALVKDAQISLGTALLPSLTRVAGAIANTLADPSVTKAVQALGDEIAGLFTESNIRDGISAVKEIAPVLISSARVMGQVVGTAVGLFRSLPPEIQKLAVGAFAINKLTGGLVTNVAGGLISSVLKQLVSGVVNVTGATVIVNGAVGGPGLVGDVTKGKPGISGAVGTAAGVILPIAAAQIIGSAIVDATGGPVAGTKDEGTGRVIAELAGIKIAIGGNTAALVRAQSRPQPTKSPEELEELRRVAAAALASQRADERTAGAIQNLRIPQPIVNVRTNVSVTAAQVQRSVIIQQRYGPGGGSRQRSGPLEFD